MENQDPAPLTQPNLPQKTPSITQPPIEPIQQPIVSPSPTISPLVSTPAPKSKKKRLIVLVLFLVLLITGGSVSALYYFKHYDKTVTDQQTIEDLNKITTALLNNFKDHSYNKNTHNDSGALPTNLETLNLKNLNNKITAYKYTINYNDKNSFQYAEEGQIYTGFDLCAVFQNKGLGFSEDEPNQPPGVFNYHRKGQQCYEYTFAALYSNGAGMVPILNSNEEFLSNVSQTTNFNYEQLASNLSTEYFAQAKLLGIQPSNNDIHKSCDANVGRTSNTQTRNTNFYQCQITINKTVVSSMSKGSLFTLLTNFATTNKSQGYSLKLLGEPGGTSVCTDNLTQCGYTSSSLYSKDCSISVLISPDTSSPAYDINYETLCFINQNVAHVPSGFNVLSN